MSKMTIYHDTCTFCVHNKNRYGTKECEFKDCGYQKEHFESVSEEEQAEIDRKIIEKEKQHFLWDLADKIAMAYLVIWIGLAAVTIFTGVVFRFSHPELTETQLILELWKHYWGLYLIMIGLVVFPRLFKR